MLWIKYKFNNPINVGTDEAPEWVANLIDKALSYGEANMEIAKREAYQGGVVIEDDGESEPSAIPLANHNITAGEYITVGGVLYKATANIPCGEPIVIGQNAIKTTIEEQLSELTKGE